MKYVLLIALLVTLLACSDDTKTPLPTPLTASLSANVTSGVAPLEVMFDASESTGNIVSYQWDFGDGNTADGVQVTHTFATGTFTVQLIVEDGEGGSSEATTILNVTAPNQAPEASFTFTPDTGDAPLEVQFDASASQDIDGEIVSYQWDFGDSNTATGVTPTHTFQSAGVFEVRLKVTDDDGANHESVSIIEVQPPNRAPVARMVISSEFADLFRGVFIVILLPNDSTVEVTFDAATSEDPDGDALTYQWDFGDGNTAEGMVVTHTYTFDPENDPSLPFRTVSLTVTDSRGASQQIEQPLELSRASPLPSSNRAPIARMVISSEFYYPSYEGRVIVNLPPNDSTVEVTFDAATSEDPDGDALTYQWDFGDGNTAEGMVVTHTYTFDPENDPSLPFRTVSLTVTDSRGASQQVEQRLQLSRASPFP